MVRVKVYSTQYCPFCRRAEALLKNKRILFEAIDVTDDEEIRKWLVQATGYKTVPQIFIDDEPIGGYQQLAALDQEGKLDALK